MPTILHADWSNRPRTAFRRWTQAVRQVAAIQVGRYRFWRALAASWRQKGKRKQVFPRAIRTTDRPSNPSPLSTRDGAQLTFGNNRIQILQTSSTLGTTQPWQPTSLSKLPTHTARGFHTNARTYNAGQRDKSPDSPVTPSRTGGEINVALQHQRMCLTSVRSIGT